MLFSRRVYAPRGLGKYAKNVIDDFSDKRREMKQKKCFCIFSLMGHIKLDRVTYVMKYSMDISFNF